MDKNVIGFGIKLHNQRVEVERTKDGYSINLRKFKGQPGTYAVQEGLKRGIQHTHVVISEEIMEAITACVAAFKVKDLLESKEGIKNILDEALERMN